VGTQQRTFRLVRAFLNPYQQQHRFIRAERRSVSQYDLAPLFKLLDDALVAQ
jgi:hypothetical protein